jgi:hypothetical protein
MKPSLVAPFLAALTVACGGSADVPDAPGVDGGNPPTGGLQPGEAGTGHLAYLVAPSRQLEIMNLTTGRVAYRSGDEEGEVQRFFLSADGSTAIFQTAANPCTRVRLPAATTSSCAPEGLVLPYPIGLSNDGSRIAFTGLRVSGGSGAGQAVATVLEGATLTDLASGDTDTVLTGGGAVSPTGDAVYTFARDPSVGENPPLSLTRHRASGVPETLFDFAAGVRAFNIVDVVLQLSEDGTRGVFPCADPAQSVAAERIAVCSVDLQTGAVVRYANAVGSLSLDGSAVIIEPWIGEGFRVYPFGSTTPSATVMNPGGGGTPTLSPDASRIAFRVRTEDALRVAATQPVAGGTTVLVQQNGEGGPPGASELRWRR